MNAKGEFIDYLKKHSEASKRFFAWIDFEEQSAFSMMKAKVLNEETDTSSIKIFIILCRLYDDMKGDFKRLLAQGNSECSLT